MNSLVFFENNQALTTSLKIAEVFEKQHKDILEKIRLLAAEISATKMEKGYSPQFLEDTYVDERGKTYPMYLLNRDAFTELVGNLNGQKAREWKRKYFAAFNKMEDTLKKLGADEVQRLQLRQVGKEIGRKPVTEAIHLLNQRDFKDGDKDPQGRKRYAAYTFKTQIKTLGIPKGGRDAANGAQLAALTLGEKNSAAILNHALETGESYHQAEAVAVNLFRQLRHLSDGHYSKLQLKEGTK